MGQRILIVSGDFPPAKSGEAAHALYIARHLAARGAAVRVLTSTIDGTAGEHGFVVDPAMASWSWAALPRLAVYLRRHAPDAILLLFLGAMYDHQPMVTFAPTLTRRLLPRARFVTQFENIPIDVGGTSMASRALRKVVARCVTGHGTHYSYGTLLRDSDALIFLTDVHRQRLAAEDASVDGKAALIPPPPFLPDCTRTPDAARDAGRRALGVQEHEFLLNYYGYIYPGKGVETLLRAVRRLCERHARLRLVLVGGFVEHRFSRSFASSARTYDGQLHELARQLGVEDRLIWTGPCPPDDERASLYFHAADACVLPFDDGLQLNNSSFAAAASHGLPIVSTRGPVLERPFVDRGNVLLVPPKDDAAMAAAIEELILDPVRRRAVGAGALDLAREWFAWERASQRLLDVLAGR